MQSTTAATSPEDGGRPEAVILVYTQYSNGTVFSHGTPKQLQETNRVHLCVKQIRKKTLLMTPVHVNRFQETTISTERSAKFVSKPNIPAV
jgi:hypothetical protein